ncbi:7338_t:CDS:2, partial [Racocetra persica]
AIINYENGINADSSVNSPTNTLHAVASTDSPSAKACTTLNACSKAKTICGSAFVPPTLNSSSHYSASDKCECSIFFYNNLTQCLTCYKNAKYNYAIDDMNKWQYDCSALGFAFTSTANSSNSDNSITIMIYLIMCAAAIAIFLGVFIMWYRKKRKIRQAEEDGNIYDEPMNHSGKKEYGVVHQPTFQLQNIQMKQRANVMGSNWNESKNTLVNSLGYIEKQSTTREVSAFEQTATQKVGAFEQTATQEVSTFKQTATQEV